MKPNEFCLKLHIKKRYIYRVSKPSRKFKGKTWLKKMHAQKIVSVPNKTTEGHRVLLRKTCKTQMRVHKNTNTQTPI